MARRPRGSAVYNPEPDNNIDPNTAREGALVEFASRLQRAMVEKGWNQSEFAREASKHLPPGATLGRDSMSQYIRGISFPSPVNLKAIAEAIGAKPADLLPTRGVKSAADTMAPVSVRDVGGENAWLRINQQVPWDKAVKILAILKEDT